MKAYFQCVEKLRKEVRREGFGTPPPLPPPNKWTDYVELGATLSVCIGMLVWEVVRVLMEVMVAHPLPPPKCLDAYFGHCLEVVLNTGDGLGTVHSLSPVQNQYPSN